MLSVQDDVSSGLTSDNEDDIKYGIAEKLRI